MNCEGNSQDDLSNTSNIAPNKIPSAKTLGTWNAASFGTKTVLQFKLYRSGTASLLQAVYTLLLLMNKTINVVNENIMRQLKYLEPKTQRNMTSTNLHWARVVNYDQFPFTEQNL